VNASQDDHLVDRLAEEHCIGETIDKDPTNVAVNLWVLCRRFEGKCDCLFSGLEKLVPKPRLSFIVPLHRLADLLLGRWSDDELS
jgi:hypothetical protein